MPTKIQAKAQTDISKIDDDIALEKVKQAKNKLVSEQHNTRKSLTVSKRSSVSADIEETKLKGDYELQTQAQTALQKLQVQSAIAANDLALTNQNLGYSDMQVKINGENVQAKLAIESVKLAETKLTASQLLEDYKIKYGETPKLSQTKVSALSQPNVKIADIKSA